MIQLITTSIHNEHQGDCKTYFNCYRNQVIDRYQDRINFALVLVSKGENEVKIIARLIF